MRKIEILQKLVGAEHLEAIKAFTALLENDLQEYEISFNKIGEIQNEFSQIVGAKIYQKFCTRA